MGRPRNSFLAKTLGGTTLAGAMDVAEHGRMAVLRDPTGAVVSVWQAKQHQGVGLWGEEALSAGASS
jgi:hypothetical protein